MDKLSYSIAELAASTGVSSDMIRRAIKAGDVIPSYVGTKPLILRDEAERWLRSLPAERKAMSS